MGPSLRLSRAWLGAVLLLGGCTSGTPEHLVATPGPEAPPEQVVQALVDAVNARDVGVVREVTTEGFATYLEQTWMENAFMTEAAVGAVLSEGAGLGTAYPDGIMVPVTFTVSGGDESLPDGDRITWGVLLTDDSGRWLAYDMGAG